MGFLRTGSIDCCASGCAACRIRFRPVIAPPVIAMSALIGPKGLLSCPNAGLSSARLPGSIAAEGSPRIGRTAIEKRLRSCTSPQFGSCLENFVIRPKVSGQTLRNVTFKCVISFY